MTQKETAQILDRAASRADMIDRDPATGKQCWYLAHLIMQNDDINNYIDSNFVLTKKRASQMINDFLSN